MTKQKIKLYLHHDLVHEIQSGTKRPLIVRILLLPFITIYHFCYATGLSLVFIVSSIWKTIWYIINQFLILRTKKLILKTLEFRLSMTVFAILLIGALLVNQAGVAISSGISLRSRVLSATTNGASQLQSAQNSLKDQQTTLAQSQFAQALAQFQKAQTDLNTSGGILQSILNLIPQKQDAVSIVSATADMTQAGITLTQTYELINSVNFSAQGLKVGVSNEESLDIFSHKLQEVQGLVSSADEKLSSVSESVIPDELKLTFLQARDVVKMTKNTLDNFSEVYYLFAELIDNDKNILVFFQNNNELRATGGFLGTYGSVQSDHGQIESMTISSIYDLDGQLKEEIKPPTQLTAVNSRWYLRDSNWFFNYPDSARKMIQFYEKSGGQTPDLVMTMTPELVISLLGVTGPIEMPTYNATLTAENFIERTQLITSIEYDRNLNKPKQMLADFFPLFLQKIGTLSLEQRLRTLEIFQGSFAKKQILLYATNPKTQERIENFNWAGKITSTDRDYLAIVQSNLGGTKTDLYIKNSVNLLTEISETGEVINTLTFTRKNTLLDTANMKNLSYLRFFVPLGSELIEATGFTPMFLPATNNTTLNIDPDIADIEANAVLNMANGTYIGNEGGKTTFGNWLELPGGQTKTITLKYKLPLTINALDRYSIVWQKQSGSQFEEATHRVHFPERLALWTTDSHNFRTEPYAVSYSHTFGTDTIAGLVLEHE
jgi:hypothetical protein